MCFRSGVFETYCLHADTFLNVFFLLWSFSWILQKTTWTSCHEPWSSNYCWLKLLRTTGVLEAICHTRILSIHFLNRDCPLRSPKEVSAGLLRPQSCVVSLSVFMFYPQSLLPTLLVSASDLLPSVQSSSFLPSPPLPSPSFPTSSPFSSSLGLSGLLLQLDWECLQDKHIFWLEELLFWSLMFSIVLGWQT